MPGRELKKTREIVHISSLIEDEDNLNLHNADNADSVEGSLDAWGQLQELTVQASTMKVLNGNLRLSKMIEMGFENVEITKIDCTDEEAEAIAIALNESQTHSVLDPSRLAGKVSELMHKGFSPESLGLVEYRMQNLIDELRESIPDQIEEAIDSSGHIDIEPPAQELRQPSAYPVPITINKAQWTKWQQIKSEIGISQDTKAFIRVAGLDE